MKVLWWLANVQNLMDSRVTMWIDFNMLLEMGDGNFSPNSTGFLSTNIFYLNQI